MVEQDVEINSNGTVLNGTACLPEGEGPFPFVLMVHGSGPLDRNENIKGQKLDIFNAIAHHLAGVGVASLRYDKRGCGKSAGNYYTAGHFDLIEDAVACVDALEQPGAFKVSSLYILGHSEGAIIAPQVSLRRPSVAGVVLLCPFAQNMESILMDQARHMRSEINELQGFKGFVYRIGAALFGGGEAAQTALLNRLKLSVTPTIRYRLIKMPAKWYRELLQLDPREIFSKVTCPMLLIGGEKDIQCNPADVAHIAELANGPVDVHIVKDLTHILRCDDRAASLFRYGKLMKKPIEPQILGLIADWLRR